MPQPIPVPTPLPVAIGTEPVRKQEPSVGGAGRHSGAHGAGDTTVSAATRASTRAELAVSSSPPAYPPPFAAPPPPSGFSITWGLMGAALSSVLLALVLTCVRRTELLDWAEAALSGHLAHAADDGAETLPLTAIDDKELQAHAAKADRTPETGRASDPLQRWYRETQERQRVARLFGSAALPPTGEVRSLSIER